ncbi:MAG: pyridoxal phosphate-dependent aminotransferase [Thiotrichales bacterium]
MPFASRLEQIEPFHVMRLLARAKELEARGRDVIHMEVGEPDFPTPGLIIEAGQSALQRGLTHYSPALGIPALREAISGYYREQFAVDISPARIVVTSGASAALQLVLLTLIDPGDGVLLTDPGYPCNRHLVTLAGGKPQAVRVDEQTNFQLTESLVEAGWQENTRAVLATTPANPTGSVLSLEQLQKLYQRTQQKGGWLIVDEIYQGLVYDQQDITALSLGEDVFVVNSFSKYFGMTGWRLGWLVAPEAAIPEIDKLAQNIYLAPSTPAQYAALAAFESATLEELDERALAFKARRDFLKPELERLGFRLGYASGGAFYLYATCDHLGRNSFDLAEDLLETCAVAVTPGRDFGTYRAEQHLRFAYTTDIDRLAEALERLEAYQSIQAS